MKLINFNLYNDPLLKKKGIYKGQTIINLYKILIRKEDFKTNNKGQFYKKIPFILENNNEIQALIYKLPKEYKINYFIKLRKLLCKYQSSNFLRRSTLKNFIKNKYYPITLLRVLGKLIDEKEFYRIIQNNYITNFSRFNKIKIPTNSNKFPDFLYYLVGIILGDGTINNERIKIVDGHIRKDKLKFSKEFLDKIQKGISKIFKTKVPQVKLIKNKNCYELIFHNKWLCYFLNSIFGLEFGNKHNPKIERNLVFNNHEKSLIIRGLFDTDGSFDKCRVSFATTYKYLMNETMQILRGAGIKKISIKTKNKDRLNPLFNLIIKSDEVLDYAKYIGFSHPLKSKYLKNYIQSNSKIRILKSVKEKKLCEIGKYFRSISNSKLRIISDFYKLDIKKKEKLITVFNYRFNCDFERIVKTNGHINSRKITKLFDELFEYCPRRKAISIQKAKGYYDNWLQIWD